MAYNSVVSLFILLRIFPVLATENSFRLGPVSFQQAAILFEHFPAFGYHEMQHAHLVFSLHQLLNQSLFTEALVSFSLGIGI